MVTKNNNSCWSLYKSFDTNTPKGQKTETEENMWAQNFKIATKYCPLVSIWWNYKNKRFIFFLQSLSFCLSVQHVLDFSLFHLVWHKLKSSDFSRTSQQAADTINFIFIFFLSAVEAGKHLKYAERYVLKNRVGKCWSKEGNCF